MMDWVRVRLRFRLRLKLRVRARVRVGFRVGFGLANAPLPSVPGRPTPCSPAELVATAARAALPARPSIAPAPACLRHARQLRASFNLAFPK